VAKVATVKLGCRLTSAAADQSKVTSVTLECEPRPVTAKVFIDASYDGEIMVALGGSVEYTAGREAISQYNESLAGARAPGWTGVSGPKNVNALNADGSIIKFVANVSQLAAPGEADDALMAFQHRMCISGDADRVPWYAPPHYEPDDFLLIQRALDATGNADFFTSMPPSTLPGYPGTKKKYCLCCGITVGSTDQPNLNKGWASASWERKQQIVADHTYFELGTFYYLANDPRVPQSVRETFNRYGLCRDEFAAFGHMPPQLYVRISNRLVGQFVITQNNIASPRAKPTSIAVGDWSFDEHMTGKFAVPVAGKPGAYSVSLEGNFWPPIKNHSNWYDVPYEAIVPKRGTGANLLVPVALSASAVAFSSTRIENMYMSVGTAAGVAAKQLVDAEVDAVQDVVVSKVQSILRDTFGQRVHGPPGKNPPPLPPAGVPSYYNVSGAGSAEWNGQYLYATLSGGSPKYQSTACSSCALYQLGGVWRLAVEGKELVYVATLQSPQPPLSPSDWSAANGSRPAPTLLAGPDRLLPG
jgi:hypothetical protein